MRQPPLRAEAADVVDPLARGALDLGDRGAVVEVRLAQAALRVGQIVDRRHQRTQYALSTWKL